MSVGLLAVQMLYRFYVVVHLSKWFTFFSFLVVYLLLSCRFLRLLVTFFGLAQAGILPPNLLRSRKLEFTKNCYTKRISPACAKPLLAEYFIRPLLFRCLPWWWFYFYRVEQLRIFRSRSPCLEAIFHKVVFRGTQHTYDMTLKCTFHTLSIVFFQIVEIFFLAPRQ